MPFLGLGGGSSSVPAPTTNQQPQANQAQFYIPQNQPGADTSYTSLLDSLLGQYTGGSTPPQQLYPGALQSALDLRNQASPGGELAYILSQINSNPYYGGTQSAANAGAGIFGGQQQLLADDLNAAITGGFSGQLAQGNYLSTLPGQINPLAEATAGLAPTATALSASTAGLGPILAALEGQVAGGVGPTQALAGTAAGQIPGINQAAGTLSGLSSGLLQRGLPLEAQLAALAARPEGVGALQSGAQDVLAASRSLYNTPMGAQKLQAASLGLLPETRALATTPAGATSLDTAGRSILAQGNKLAALPQGGGQLFDASQNLLNAGYDPQNALRKQLTQQTTDQSNAINAMSGLSSSPYGAGLTSDALNQFNINWQNQQLQREQSALAGATSGFEGAQALRQGKQNFLTNAAAAASGAFGEAENIRAQKAAIAEGGVQAAGAGLRDATALRQAREGMLTSGLGAASGAFGQAGSLLANKANMINQALAGTEGLYQGAGGLTTQGANALAQGAGVAGTAGGLYGQAAGIGGQAGALTQGQGTLYDQAVRQLLGAGGLYGQGISGLATGGQAAGQAAGVYGQLPGTANAATAGVGALASGAAGAGALPGEAFMRQLAADTGGVNSLINALTASISGAAGGSNVGTQQYALPETVLSDIANYLKLGQNSSLAGGQLGLLNEQGNQPDLAGIGSLAQGAGLGGLAFGSQGLGGALGLGSGGLFGAASGLFGPGLSAGEAGSLSGFGGAFGGAIPASAGTGAVGEALDLGTLLFE